MAGSHARLSPSASERWLHCPGSVALSEAVPQSPPSKFAMEGTAAHTALDNWLGDGTPLAIGDEVVITEQGEDHRFDYTEEMHAAVKVAYDYVQSLGGKQHYETRVVPTSVSPLCAGRADVTVWHGGASMLECIDYKHGAGVFVDIRDNPQLRLYAIGCLDTFGYDADFIKMTVIQPRCQQGAPIRSEVLLVDELREWAKTEVLPAIEATTLNEPYLNIGDWCRWCPVGEIGRCPERNQAAVSMFDVIENQEPVQRPGNELALMLGKCDELEAWCKSIRAASKAEIEQGGEVPGWKIIQGLGNRAWIDEAKASATFKKALGVKAFAPQKLLSPAQMEKISTQEAVAKFTERPLGSTSLVKESAAGQALTFSPVFDQVE